MIQIINVPGIQADLDALKNLVHHLDSLVLLLHLLLLQLPRLGRDDAVQGDEQDHDEEAGHHARAEGLPEQEEGHADLKRSAKKR